MEYVHPIRDKEIIERMKDYLKKRNERDYILFMLGLNTGLRVQDILDLKVIDVRGELIKVKERKTKKHRRIPINRELRRALNAYIYNKDDQEYLIASRQKNKQGLVKGINRSTAYRIIKEAARQSGFKDNCGTHTMRKTFGYMHYKKYNNLAALKKIFNHDTEAITFAYIGLETDYLDGTIMGLNL